MVQVLNYAKKNKFLVSQVACLYLLRKGMLIMNQPWVKQVCMVIYLQLKKLKMWKIPETDSCGELCQSAWPVYTKSWNTICACALQFYFAVLQSLPSFSCLPIYHFLIHTPFPLKQHSQHAEMNWHVELFLQWSSIISTQYIVKLFVVHGDHMKHPKATPTINFPKIESSLWVNGCCL